MRGESLQEALDGVLQRAPEGTTTVRRKFRRLLAGFSGELDGEGRTYFERLGAAISPDGVVSHHAYASQTVSQLNADASTTNWNLDRLDQRSLPLDGRYVALFDGQGAHVMMVDSGVNLLHNDFVGRIDTGFDFIEEDDSPQDCNGHGSHTAAIALGTTFGVAKRATLHALRVLDCDGFGTLSNVLRALEWIAAYPVPASRKVASLSLGGAYNNALNAAVDALRSTGCIVVVSAGNNGSDACAFSPASAAGAFAVGMIDRNDVASSESNSGPCVSMLAPGVEIVSADQGSATASHVLSGTSMAAPHVAGVIAQIISFNLKNNISGTAIGVAQSVLQSGVSGNISDSAERPGRNVPNLLLQALNSAKLPGPPLRPPPNVPNQPPLPPSPLSPPFPPLPPSASSLTVRVRPDLFPQEVSWVLLSRLDDGSKAWTQMHAAQLAAGDGLTAWTINVPESFYRWVLRDSFGDGICCAFGSGYYELLLDEKQLARGTLQASSSLLVDFAVGNITVTLPPPSLPPSPPVGDDASQFTLNIALLPDAVPEDISWTLLALKPGVPETVVAQAALRATDTGLQMWERELSPNTTYRFVLFDKSSNGICCGFGRGSLSLRWQGRHFWSTAVFTVSSSHTFTPSLLSPVLLPPNAPPAAAPLWPTPTQQPSPDGNASDSSEATPPEHAKLDMKTLAIAFGGMGLLTVVSLAIVCFTFSRKLRIVEGITPSDASTQARTGGNESDSVD